MVKGHLGETLVTFLIYYAPNTNQVAFFHSLLRSMAPEFEGEVILAVDSNLALDLIRDKSQTAGLRSPPKESRKFAQLLHYYDLIDAWREANPTSRDYSHYSRAHGHYSRIDHVFLLSGLLSKLNSAKILSTFWSDHDPVMIQLSDLASRVAKSHWRLNESLLSDESHCLEISNHLKFYFDTNRPEDTSPAINWATHKASVRGIFILLSSRLKKAHDELISAKTKEYEALAKQHKRSPSPNLFIKIEQSHLGLNICLTKRAEKQLRWTNHKFFTWRDRPGSLLARKLTPRHTHMALTKIRLSGGHLSQDPQKILGEFHKFYADLYGSPRDAAPSSIREFLGNLPLSSIADDHRDLMDQPFTGEEIYNTIKTLSLHKSPGPDGLPNSYYKKKFTNSWLRIWLYILIPCRMEVWSLLMKIRLISVLFLNLTGTLLTSVITAQFCS